MPGGVLACFASLTSTDDSPFCIECILNSSGDPFLCVLRSRRKVPFASSGGTEFRLKLSNIALSSGYCLSFWF